MKTAPAPAVEPINWAKRIRSRHRFHIDDAKGEHAAHVDVLNTGHALWIDNLWVSADLRRKGVARALLKRVLDEYGHEHTLYLELLPFTDAPLDGTALAALYGSVGFIHTQVPGVMYRPAGYLLAPERPAREKP